MTGTANNTEWYALRVRPRQELILERELRAMSLRPFAPIIRQQKVYAGQVANVVVAVVPGYVFLLGSPSEVQRCRKSGRVLSVVRIEDQDRFSEELEALQKALSIEAFITPTATVTENQSDSVTQALDWTQSRRQILSWVETAWNVL
jgi:hypothetical protein